MTNTSFPADTIILIKDYQPGQWAEGLSVLGSFSQGSGISGRHVKMDWETPEQSWRACAWLLLSPQIPCAAKQSVIGPIYGYSSLTFFEGKKKG